MHMFLLAVLLTVAMIVPARAADHVIANDDGGFLLEYVSRFWQWEKAGDTVIIEGKCRSSCTLVLGIFPPEKVCAGPNAQFGFHSASDGPNGLYSDGGTRLMWSFYAGRVAHVLASHGWAGPSPHPEMLAVGAQEVVRPCQWEDYHSASAAPGR